MSVWIVFLLLMNLYGSVITDKLCSEFVNFVENGVSRTGHFEVRSGRANSFLQVTIFVSKECEENSCDISLNTDLTTEERLRNGQPLELSVSLRGASKTAQISGVVLRNSAKCQVLCSQNKVLDADVKSLELTNYPYGRDDKIEAVCNAVDTLLSSKRFVETCGMRRSGYTKLALGGQDFERGYWPWLVAVLHRKYIHFEFQCGATLISRRAILTAAHCLFGDNGQRLNHDDVVVQLGRHNLSYIHEDGSADYHAQRIIVHHEYQPSQTTSESDLGLILISRDVEFSPFIAPACIWEGVESIDPLVNKTGVVAGWGIDETQLPTPVPKKVSALITSHEECIRSDATFGYIATKRNFCAGSLDGSGPCKGDSGGALMIDVSGRWMVRGIVSTAIHDNMKQCDLYKYVVYTDVAKYKGWIISQLPRSSVPVTNIFSRVISSDENESPIESPSPMEEDSNDIECGVVASRYRITNLIYMGSHMGKGTWPWMAAIFNRRESNHDPPYFFGGTIISNKAILTDARHLYINHNVNDYRVIVGRHDLSSLSEGQELEIEKILVHSDYNIYNRPSIGIIKVKGMIRFNDLVRPACLWEAASDYKDVVGRIGQVVGWGETEMYSFSKMPSKVKARIISSELCLEFYPEHTNIFSGGIFCAGQLDSSGPCDNDVGDGLLVYENKKWTLRGVVTARYYEESCSEKAYAIYVDVARYRSWINENMT